MQKLKEIVDTLYSLPAEERLKKLLQTTSMGDMRPSEYLAHIRELQGANSDPNSPLIRTYFSQSLPSSIAPFVTMLLESHDLDAVAKIADKSIKSTAPAPIRTVAAVNAELQQATAQLNAIKFTDQPSRMQQSVDSLRSELNSFRVDMEKKFEVQQVQINMLTSQCSNLQQLLVNQAKPRYGEYDRSRSNSRSRRNYFSANQQRSTGLCYYHNKFGSRATKCMQPCNFDASENK